MKTISNTLSKTTVAAVALVSLLALPAHAATPDIGNRIKLSLGPFCWPDPFVAANPDTDKDPAAP